jgi:predicted dehydrogenase
MGARKTVNVGMIGYKFMGKAHSNAWLKAPRFFEPPSQPVLKVVCGRHRGPLEEFATRWGWEETAVDWQEIVNRDDIDVVDIACPTFLHFEIAMAAAKAGKAIFCEKPFTLTLEQAERLAAEVERRGVVNYLNHNYRRCPAIGQAKAMIEAGELGRIFHWRGAYLQSWIMDPDFPLTWQLREEAAGAGPHWDLNSHSVDLARYLVGDVKAVNAMTTQFIGERPLPDEAASGAFQAGEGRGDKARVTVEDAAFMLAEFENGALGSFEASRFATGRKNFNFFEISGEKGALAFNLERMNELQFLRNSEPAATRGFTTIHATEADHPYAAHWWPPAHNIGYEHTFVHAVADFLEAMETGSGITPGFRDGTECIRVLAAGLESARSGRRVAVSEVGKAGTA